ERRIARQLLLQLVARTTRRSVARAQLVAAVGPDAEAVIDRLLRARLLVQRSPGDEDSAIVEIAHESLLQTWAQLARWIDESRDERRLLEELEDATALWERRGRRPADTWSQAELDSARHRASQLELALPARAQAFLTAGDERHLTERRKRRLRYGTALAAGGVMAILASTLITRYLAREELIRANVGTVDLVLTPFDWIDDGARIAAASELPELAWELYSSIPGDLHTPGPPIRAADVERVSSSSDGIRRVDRVRAQAGQVFLKITGRGRAGQSCSPSWIRIESFPGYGGAEGPRRLEIAFPTCQATQADMIFIEEGAFVYGGPGVTPSRHHDHPDYTQERQEITLPAFWMDRTEVSNAAFAVFGRLQRITGYAPPRYGTDETHRHDGDWDIPVTNVDAFTAEAFCRYMGKQLPGEYEWVKAARGGKHIHGVANPYPERQYPWGPDPSPTCVNQKGTEDGAKWTAPVGSYACGAGPYGHLNLVGNADEWISRDKQLDRDTTPLYVLRGGSVISPPELEHTSISYRNHRDPSWIDYAVGFRCVTY
ncbi:MAG TPA: SUMF1/EgtB/PvdO family nonheme iron enzyme, partial [Kofleriaceae bacterium]|nr:SUMF1/EgtB/PvdO family nonheme iron enzyme [Kofleriaceae bacterium]